MKDQISLDIRELSPDGNGRGVHCRDDGKECLIDVPCTMPGDVAHVRLHRKKKGVRLGHATHIERPSPKRQPSRCIHFGTCGGCLWQHIPYEEQLKIKEKRVKDLFCQDTLPIIPCDHPWHYRNKMEFSFSKDASGAHFLGLGMRFQRGRVCSLSECHLVNPWYLKALETTKKWQEAYDIQAYHPYQNTGTLRTLTLRESKQSKLAMLTVSGLVLEIDAWVSMLCKAMNATHLSIVLRTQNAKKGQVTTFFEKTLFGPGYLKETLHLENQDIPLLIRPSAFFQPNTKQAEKIYDAALKLANVSKDSIVYDLYAGVGTLGLVFATKAAKVLSIELSSDAVTSAKENAARHDHITIMEGDVAKTLKTIQETKSFPKPDIAIVDPPRAGLGPKALKEMTIAPKIVYISCNIETQKKDVSWLVQNGYHIDHIQPIDQFPQTPHLENIIILSQA